MQARKAGAYACATVAAVIVLGALGMTGCDAHPPRLSPDVYSPAHRTVAAAARDFFNMRPAARQPLPFPHNTHLAKEAMCTDCHETVERGPIAGIPSVKTCMICHS